MIDVEELRKEFRVYRHHRGTLGALRNLVTREYRVVHAVDGVSFHLDRGELVGYLGPNGAGKSTTIKILTGILTPSSGRVTVGGRVPWKQRREHTQHIGVVFGQRSTLWWDLPVIESFDLLHAIYQVPEGRYRANLATFVELLELGPFLNTPVRSLSLGQRMRVDLAAALLHDPEVLFLDEPTIGLDVVAKQRIRQFILTMNRERGATVILTTHDLGDVEKLCERVIMINQGRLMFDGPLADLRERFGGERVLVVDFETVPAELDLPGVRLLRREAHRAWLAVGQGNGHLAEIMPTLFRDYQVRDLSIEETEIEEIVRRIYLGDYRLEDGTH
jgi:ABC-2 type transport system ATP-binding protein